jgi:hypothetical protein
MFARKQPTIMKFLPEKQTNDTRGMMKRNEKKNT